MKVEELFDDPLNEAFDNNSYYRSFMGRIKKMYEKAAVRTRHKGYDAIIDQQEFFKLAEQSPEYKKMFKQWEKSGYDIRFTPTLDRKNAGKGYVKGNLQFLTYTDNIVKGNKEYDKRPSEARKRKVQAVRGSQKKTFNSMTELSTFLSKSNSTITRALQQSGQIDGWTLKFV